MHRFNELYKNGINLGGWLSQYNPEFKVGHAHFDTFITEKDIALIAGYGLDHVRMPLDYYFFNDDSTPHEYSEAALSYIDRLLEWCAKHSLAVIIDMHRAPGYSFDTQGENTLLDNPASQARFAHMWEMLAKRYLHIRETLTFEILNEIVDTDSTRWNALAAQVTAAIRAIDPTRYVLIGANEYGSVRWLDKLDIYDDENIIYAFHFYEPFLFTHQFARWSPVCKDFATQVAYPGVTPGVAEFMQKFPQHADNPAVKNYVTTYMDKAHMRKLLQPVFDFMSKTGKVLYCSEFGVIEDADATSRLAWHKDFYEIMAEAGIGFSVWNYKCLNFSFVNRNSTVVAEELFRLTGESK